MCNKMHVFKYNGMWRVVCLCCAYFYDMHGFWYACALVDSHIHYHHSIERIHSE